MPDLTPEPIRYTVRFPADRTQYAEVEACFPLAAAEVDGAEAGKLEVELYLPVWTPGSYLIREYARHIEALTAFDPQQNPLAVVKTRKNRWLVKSDFPLHEILIRYRLYCNELTVRTNFLDDTFAVLHGAATFLAVLNAPSRPHEVTLKLPPNWTECWSGMAGSDNTFQAPDYDALVDSPIVAGNPSTQSFVIDGKPHIVLNFGDSTYWDVAKAVEDLERIVLHYRAMWGELPYDRYLFFNLLTGGRGALEHRNSMVLMADRFAMRTRKSYTAWLNLVSHEFFHVWNAKRLRPVELGPFDYENEVYTRNLWITEGFTEYYGPLAVRRANLTTTDEFLTTLTGLIEGLQNAPGRLQQPVATASFDAWIKLYRPDENSRNSSISYYTKGAVVAWLLDGKIRSATGSARSLDDVMRLAYRRHSGPRGFSTDEFHQVAQEVAGVHLKSWLHQATETTDELDYREALSWFGLRFKPNPNCASRKPWLGFTTKTDANRLLVTEVLSGTPANEAGVYPGDEILAVGNYRVHPDQWASTLEQFHPNELISLLVSRRDRLLTIPVRLGEEPLPKWVLDLDPEATGEQRKHLTDWLGPS